MVSRRLSMFYARTTQYTRRIICPIFLAFLSIGPAACANPTNSSQVTDIKPSATAGPEEISQAFRFGVPVENEANAIIAAQVGLKTGFEYTALPRVVKVEQMSYGEYSKPPVTGVTPSPPFPGCVYVATSALDGP
jgi:hypothetical protein